VKTKDQVKEAWDYEEITKTVPAAEAYAAPDGSCKLS
jgi:branched-chain amino acid transport system substrate-binding protein